MYPPCVSVNEFLIPEVRKRVSKKLKARGMKENDIAKKLRISQGMVSRYLSMDNNSLLDKFAENISQELSDRIIQNYSEIENTELFCEHCMKIRKSLEFCNFHSIENCSLCSYLYSPERNIEKSKVIKELKDAVSILSKYNVDEIIPQVRTNIAYSLPDPKDLMDIAAFPGRISSFRGKIIYFGDPEFGASTHLSKILLNSGIKGKRCVMNIRYDKRFEEKMKNIDLQLVEFDREKSREIENFVKNIDFDYDAIIDEGSFGIEPTIYIFGKDPKDVINIVTKLMDVKE